MDVPRKIIAVSIFICFFLSCVSPHPVETLNSPIKNEKSFLAALEHIESGDLVEAKKLIDPQWVDKFAPLIQSTVPGCLKPGMWGFSRARDNKLYYFIYNWQPGHFMQFPNSELPIDSAKCLNSGESVQVKWAIGVEVFLDKADRDPVGTVIEMSMKGFAENLHPVSVSDWTDPTLNAKMEVIREWQNDRFGMFIHWGPSSLLAKEISWSRRGSKLGRIRYGGSGVNGEYKVDLEYDTLYKSFNPTKFDADAWVQTAMDAGMRYIVLTAKHHDGFCLFDSKVTDYDIMSTPYGKDICKQLADACHENGIKLGWYYSPRDWYHRDFGGDNHRRYMDFAMKQLEELLTNYGKIDILWFDCFDSPQYLWKNFAEESFRKIRQWQPEIIINDRGGLRGDYDTPEQSIGAFERQRPWETCVTIGHGWSWQGKDIAKPLDWCINTLIQTVSRDGNLLLNVSPQPDGLIPEKQIQRLNEMGQWLAKHAEAIYGTRGGPFIDDDNISSTCKEDKIFLHYTGKERSIQLSEFGYKILSSSLLNGGETSYKEIENGWEVSFHNPPPNEIDLIIELKIDGSATDIEPMDISRSL